MAGTSTPVMKQHAVAKAAHPDCIVFFRLGDFYEMFGEDAVVASQLLELTLTSRNKGKPDEIPMAGVPHHAAHGYIARLLRAGRKVAICEQMADPATVKGIVPREVIRVITPGTWNAGEQSPALNNWLCAVELAEGGVGVALLDLSTAELMAAVVDDLSQALSEIGRAHPNEILLGASAGAHDAASALKEVQPGAQVRLDRELSAQELTRALAEVDLAGADGPEAMAVARAVRYALECFQGRSFPVWRIARFNPSGLLGLDRAAQRHLELVESSVDDPGATLLAVLDRTRSPIGARLLRRRLLMPLTDIVQIRRRLDQVDALVLHPKVRDALDMPLGQLGDLERLAVRASLGESTPRDLGNVRRGLAAARDILSLIKGLPDVESVEMLGLGEVDVVDDLREALARALVERPPATTKEGAVFLSGYDDELDRLYALRTNGNERMAELEEELRSATGIGNLRIKYTRVFGWYVEVTRSASAKVPASFRRKQTVAGGERYTLDRLDELALEIESAEDLFRARELALLSDLVALARTSAARIHGLAAKMATLDVAVSLAKVAADSDYCRPEVSSSDELTIEDGRHPVVEKLAAAGRFVPNDVRLNVRTEHLWLISGPNMAGKSTFLRQVALIVILAQMGSYVPARSAHIGLCDRVLSRVGANDNLAGGESTFMVEMRETASILRQATSRSLVILDEVGRGTSTFDGLAIAWALAEHLDQVVRCRTLFATHYHELTTLIEVSPTAQNYCVMAREHEGNVIFLHRLAKGAASRSYGIAVASLAGLPASVIGRAREVLIDLENGRAEHLGPDGTRQLDLFRSPDPPPDGEHAQGAAEVLSTIRTLDTDRITGIEALMVLHELKRKLTGE